MEPLSPPETQTSWEEATEITWVSLSGTVAVSMPVLCPTCARHRQPMDLLAEYKIHGRMENDH